MKRLRRDPLAVAGLLLVAACILAAAGAPWFTGADPYDNDLASAMQPPGPEHLLGADDQGRDMLVRLLFGLRLTLAMGAAAVLLGGGIGAALGLLAAFYRALDGWVMRVMDVLLSFPAILFGLAIAAIFGPGTLAVVLALSVATIPLAARIVRATAIVEMRRDYMEAARAVGMGDDRLILRHLLPNCLTEANVWIPLVREQLWVASSRRTEGVRAHGLYGIGVYKGLDITLAK